MMRILIVIPAYNEEKRVGDVINECLDFSPHVLAVNDGSSDNTLDEIKKTKAVVLNNEINRGKGYCLKRGFGYAVENGFDALITLDADGQHDPQYIPEFIKKIEEGSDAVIGTRHKRRSSMPYHRRASNFLLSLVFSLICRQWIKDTQSGYRAFRVDVLKDLELVSNSFETEAEILMKLARRGVRFSEAAIPVIYGEEKSHINVAKEFFRFVKVLRYRK